MSGKIQNNLTSYANNNFKKKYYIYLKVTTWFVVCKKECQQNSTPIKIKKLKFLQSSLSRSVCKKYKIFYFFHDFFKFFVSFFIFFIFVHHFSWVPSVQNDFLLLGIIWGLWSIYGTRKIYSKRKLRPFACPPHWSNLTWNSQICWIYKTFLFWVLWNFFLT